MYKAFWLHNNVGLSVFKQRHRCHADADHEAEVSDGRPSNLLHHDAAYSGGDGAGQVEQRRANANHGACKEKTQPVLNGTWIHIRNLFLFIWLVDTILKHK